MGYIYLSQPLIHTNAHTYIHTHIIELENTIETVLLLMGEKNINERVPSSFPFTRFWGKTVLWVSLVQGYIECAIVFAIQYILWAFSQCSALLCDFVCSFLHLYRMCMHMWIILIKALHTSIPSPKKLFLLQGRHFISVHGIFNCNKFCPWKASSGPCM